MNEPTDLIYMIVSSKLNNLHLSYLTVVEAYLDHRLTSKTELFAKPFNGFKLLTIFVKKLRNRYLIGYYIHFWDWLYFFVLNIYHALLNMGLVIQEWTK